MKSPQFSRSPGWTLAVLAGVALLGTHQADAIAPSQQRTMPTAGSNLHSVVDILFNAGADEGTGSVVGKFTQQENGMEIGYFCVLTAEHVLYNRSTGKTTGVTSIGFGDPAFANTYPIQWDPNAAPSWRGGSTGDKDLAVFAVRYGKTDAFYTGVKQLSLWDAPDVTDAALATAINGNLAGYKFTEIGYGYTATPRLNGANAIIGYDAITTELVGKQRFQNSTPTMAAQENAGPNGTKYLAAYWTPGYDGNGKGGSFSGDSGGPYFTSGNVQITVSGLPDPTDATKTLPDKMISIADNSIFAVHSFGRNNYDFATAANSSGGVILTKNDVDWINGLCAMVPEPGTAILFFGGAGLMLVLRRGRRD